MLDSLFVRNFRLFKELKIERLGRVNLIAGKNNSGKSCLLEALWIYAGKASLKILDTLLSERDEYWSAELQESNGSLGLQKQTLALPVSYLFHNRRLPLPLVTQEEGIEIGPLDKPDQRLCIQIALYALSPYSLGKIRLDLQALPEGLDITTIEPTLELIYDGKSKKLFSLMTDLYKFPDKPFLEGQTPPVFHLPANERRTSQPFALLWDQVNLTELEEHVIGALQVIDPKVKGIAFFGESSRRIPVIRYADGDQRLPLSHLGDGMTQILHIILTLVNTRNGFLLVDEFENGLHWSIMPKVWDTIFILAGKLNIQVFATTHSRDCIRGFEMVWQKNESLGSFHRLDPDPEYGARVTSYELETLSDALEMDVEVR